MEGKEPPTKIQKKSTSAAEINERILAAAVTPKGVTQEEIQEQFVKSGIHVELEVLAQNLNDLLQQGLVAITKEKPDGPIRFIAVNPQTAAKFKGLNAEERLIYQLIEEAKIAGVWIRILKARSNIQQTKIPKILATLEKRKLIKAVKTESKKKVYMLYELEPPKKFDVNPEKMSYLSRKCEDYIAQKKFASIEDINNYLQTSTVLPEEIAAGGRVELTLENVQSIIDTLIYDGKVEDFKAPLEQRGRRAGGTLYKLAKLSVMGNSWENRATLPLNALNEAPCGICPVFSKCSDEGEITPLTCPYLKDWMEF